MMRGPQKNGEAPLMNGRAKINASERELLEKTLGGSIKVMTEILSAVAPDSFQQSAKLRDRALLLADLLGVKETWELEIGVTLSKLGHVTIPPGLLERARSGTRLTDAEQDMIERVPETGAAMLSNIPRLEGAAAIVASQARNFADGGGTLPLGARILKVLNDIESLSITSEGPEEVFGRMEANSGAYDPAIFALALQCFGPDAPQSIVENSKRACTVSIDQLCVGDRLCFPIKMDNRLVIAPADTVITATLLRRLRNFSELGNIHEQFVIIPGGPAWQPAAH